MRLWGAIATASALMLAACAAATALIAHAFDHQAALGAPLLVYGAESIYPPWAVFGWSENWAGEFPRPFAVARFIIALGIALAALSAIVIAKGPRTLRPFGQKAWADFKDAQAARLFASSGTILGKFEGKILCFDGPEHQLLIGASRSGKGRGHVVPTLLTWPHSALVLDVKGELADGDGRYGFPGTAGFRETLGPVLRFAPTRSDSACFNPLLEIRRGENEVRDAQNIIEIIVDPAGARPAQDFWDRSAKAVLVGLVLHVLYTEPVARKTLAVVREKLRDLEKTAQEMRATLHRRNPLTGAPETHPEILHAAESFLAGEERMQAAIKVTAESFFGAFADPLVAQKTATSDFRIGDLMCGNRPVTLYLQPPPSDATRLMPLMRLVLNQIARGLMESQTHDAQGREKTQRLILVLDEFPQLGRMPFFETAMGAMAGYGLKAYLVCQSLNHIIRAYGRDNVILDNCHVLTSFAAADMETARAIAAMAGEVWEMREQDTLHRPRPLLSGKGSTTLREERRPLLLPGDVRALAPDNELIFVAGAKPIRAKKIRFDQEKPFRDRLRPTQRTQTRLTIAHDWTDVHALGQPFSAEYGAMGVGVVLKNAAQGDLFDATPPARPPKPEPKPAPIPMAPDPFADAATGL